MVSTVTTITVTTIAVGVLVSAIHSTGEYKTFIQLFRSFVPLLCFTSKPRLSLTSKKGSQKRKGGQ